MRDIIMSFADNVQSYTIISF